MGRRRLAPLLAVLGLLGVVAAAPSGPVSSAAMAGAGAAPDHGAGTDPAAGTATGADAVEVARPDAAAARSHPSPATHAGPDAGTQATDALDVPVGIVEVLDGLARGLAAGDPAAVAALLDDPADEVGQRWQDRAEHLRGVPVHAYALRVDRRLGEVTSARVRAAHDDEVRVIAVVEQLRLEGEDAADAAQERRTLTFVRRGAGWRLADDRDGRVLGRSTPTQLWDLGPVVATRRGDALALHHPDAPGVDPLLDETAAALDLLDERWPRDWPRRPVLLVPADREELDALLDADLHLDDFLAFATATTVSAPGEHRLVGSRVVVNPDRFPTRSREVRERVLVHELLHAATRPVGSAALPLWLEEGVAQALGEQGPSTGTARRLDALGPDGRRLPRDDEFTAAGRDETHLAYQRAWSFTEHLVRVHGAEAVAAFYVAAGAAVTTAGTSAHHLDVAARAELGDDLDGLVARWRAAG